jgi:hypothetical protein
MGGPQETQGGANNAGAMGIYDPSFNYGGTASPWSGVGTGLQQFGSSVSRGSQSQGGYMTPTTGLSPYVPQSGVAPGLIAPPQQSGDLMALLQRLLGGGGY